MINTKVNRETKKYIHIKNNKEMSIGFFIICPAFALLAYRVPTARDPSLHFKLELPTYSKKSQNTTVIKNKQKTILVQTESIQNHF